MAYDHPTRFGYDPTPDVTQNTRKRLSAAQQREYDRAAKISTAQQMHAILSQPSVGLLQSSLPTITNATSDSDLDKHIASMTETMQRAGIPNPTKNPLPQPVRTTGTNATDTAGNPITARPVGQPPSGKPAVPFTPAERMAALQQSGPALRAAGINVGGGHIVPEPEIGTVERTAPKPMVTQNPDGSEDVTFSRSPGDPKPTVGHISGSITRGAITDANGNQVASPAGLAPGQALRTGTEWHPAVISKYPGVERRGSPENIAFANAFNSAAKAGRPFDPMALADKVLGQAKAQAEVAKAMPYSQFKDQEPDPIFPPSPTLDQGKAQTEIAGATPYPDFQKAGGVTPGPDVPIFPPTPFEAGQQARTSTVDALKGGYNAAAGAVNKGIDAAAGFIGVRPPLHLSPFSTSTDPAPPPAPETAPPPTPLGSTSMNENPTIPFSTNPEDSEFKKKLASAPPNVFAYT